MAENQDQSTLKRPWNEESLFSLKVQRLTKWLIKVNQQLTNSLKKEPQPPEH
jgi:hypothetical protein